MTRQTFRQFRPALFIFIFLNAGFVILKERLTSKGFDTSVLILGNLLLFAISLLSFHLLSRGLKSKNNPLFLRMFYSSFVVKFFALAVIAFAYIMMAQKNVNKPSLFFCLALYLLYTFIEINGLMKLSKEKPDA